MYSKSVMCCCCKHFISICYTGFDFIYYHYWHWCIATHSYSTSPSSWPSRLCLRWVQRSVGNSSSRSRHIISVFRNTPAADWPAATAADQKEFNPPDIRLVFSFNAHRAENYGAQFSFIKSWNKSCQQLIFYNQLHIYGCTGDRW